LSVGGGKLFQCTQPLTDLMSGFLELARLADATGAPQLLSVLEQFLVPLRAFDLKPKALVGVHLSIVRWDCLGQVSGNKTVTYVIFMNPRRARVSRFRMRFSKRAACVRR